MSVYNLYNTCQGFLYQLLVKYADNLFTNSIKKISFNYLQQLYRDVKGL